MSFRQYTAVITATIPIPRCHWFETIQGDSTTNDRFSTCFFRLWMPIIASFLSCNTSRYAWGLRPYRSRMTSRRTAPRMFPSILPTRLHRPRSQGRHHTPVGFLKLLRRLVLGVIPYCSNICCQMMVQQVQVWKWLVEYKPWAKDHITSQITPTIRVLQDQPWVCHPPPHHCRFPHLPCCRLKAMHPRCRCYNTHHHRWGISLGAPVRLHWWSMAGEFQ